MNKETVRQQVRPDLLGLRAVAVLAVTALIEIPSDAHLNSSPVWLRQQAGLP